MSKARRLIIDAELTPNLAYVWKMWGDQYINSSQLLEAAEIMCFAAKWYGETETMYWSTFHDGKEQMIQAAHELIDMADIVIHFNGKRFDIPHFNREFLLAKMAPPSPVKQIDLLQVVKSRFKLPYNTLDYVAQTLGVGGKVQHMGFELWKRCMNNEAEAWELMREYNIGDITITEGVYTQIIPWMTNHPNMNIYEELEDGCPHCGSDKLQRRGQEPTASRVYWRFQCMSCLGWARATVAEKDIVRPTVVSI